MQRNVQISENVFIQDLGSGYSYVNFNRKKEIIENEVFIIAEQQYRVKNPATYSNIVNSVVKENYPDGADEAALRKGIINSVDVDFLNFNSFVEHIKQMCKDEGIF